VIETAFSPVGLASRENLVLKQTEELLQQNDGGPGHEREMTRPLALPRKPLNSA